MSQVKEGALDIGNFLRITDVLNGKFTDLETNDTAFSIHQGDIFGGSYTAFTLGNDGTHNYAQVDDQVRANEYCDKTGGNCMTPGSGGGSDTLAGLNCATNQIAKWNGSAWVCGSDAGSTGYGVVGGWYYWGSGRSARCYAWGAGRCRAPSDQHGWCNSGSARHISGFSYSSAYLCLSS